MTSRQGKRTPRKTPEPLLAIAQTYQEPEIVCPHCAQAFFAKQLEGKFLERFCPCCGKKILPSNYDEKAAPLLERTAVLLGALRRYRRKEAFFQEKVDACTKWWKAPEKWLLALCWSVYRKVNADKIEAQSAEYDLAKKELCHLAKFRYYTSEWFACTHVHLFDEGGPLKACYHIETGKYEAFPARDRKDARDRKGAAGTLGEMTVFDLFLQEVQKPSSALQGAYLLPNLFIPLPSDELRTSRSFWSQIDLIVLTRQCAFVVEIKNWRASVFVEKETGKIYSSKQWTQGRQCIQRGKTTYHEVEDTLDQNSNHASWFYEICKAYPFERVYEVTLFLNTRSFESTFEGFDNNIFAGEISASSLGSLKIMENECRNLENLLSEQELYELSQDLLNRYGDLNQKRSTVHKHVLERNRSE